MYCSNNVEMIFHSLMMYCSLAVNHYLPLRIGKEMLWSSSETSESKCFSFLHLSKTKINQKKIKQIRSPSLSFYFFFVLFVVLQCPSFSLFLFWSPHLQKQKRGWESFTKTSFFCRAIFSIYATQECSGPSIYKMHG